MGLEPSQGATIRQWELLGPGDCGPQAMFFIQILFLFLVEKHILPPPCGFASLATGRAGCPWAKSCSRGEWGTGLAPLVNWQPDAWEQVCSAAMCPQESPCLASRKGWKGFTTLPEPQGCPRPMGSAWDAGQHPTGERDLGQIKTRG